jgi:hypothetical protein
MVVNTINNNRRHHHHQTNNFSLKHLILQAINNFQHHNINHKVKNSELEIHSLQISINDWPYTISKKV